MDNIPPKGRGRGRGFRSSLPNEPVDNAATVSTPPRSPISQSLLESALETIPVRAGRGRGKARLPLVEVERSNNDVKSPGSDNLGDYVWKPDVGLPEKEVSPSPTLQSGSVPSSPVVLSCEPASPSTSTTSDSTSKIVIDEDITDLVPQFYNPPKPSKRLKHLGESEVKILSVPTGNSNGCMTVAFQDPASLVRFKCLMRKITNLYQSPEGYRLRKTSRTLEPGQIAVASVSVARDDNGLIFESKFRRVKIKNIKYDVQGRFQASVVDIDSLAHWRTQVVFAIIPPFYEHPAQACPIRIRNAGNLYPKGVFEPLFGDDQDAMQDIMSGLTREVFESMIGHNIYVSNITVDTENEDALAVEVDLSKNPRMEALFVDVFCRYYTPEVPEVGKFCDGIITEVVQSGVVSNCLPDYLLEPIDELLNTDEFHEMMAKITKSGSGKLLKEIATSRSQIFLALDEEKNKIVRMKVIGVMDGKVRCTFVDTGKETLVKEEHVLCRVRDHPTLPPVLALLPPQALQFQLADVRMLKHQTCREIYEQYKTGISFVVTNDLYSQVRKFPEVELYDPEDSSDEPLNSKWKASLF